MEYIVNEYHALIENPNMATEIFEDMIEKITAEVSATLWYLLRDQMGFMNSLQAIRNTYLLGKGELFHSIIDGIVQFLELSPANCDNADILLNRKILFDTAKSLNLDENSLNNVIQLRLNSPNISMPANRIIFSSVCLSGVAKNKPANHTEKCGTILITSSTYRPASSIFKEVWSKYLIKKPKVLCSKSDLDENSSLSDNEIARKCISTNNFFYSVGCLWFPDQKYLSKGFEFTSTFYCDWSNIFSSITASHPIFIPDSGYNQYIRRLYKKYNERDASSNHIIKSNSAILGTLCCILHGDRQGTTLIPTGALANDVTGSVSAGVTFHGMTNFHYFVFNI
jgi:hypothetical protein